MRNSILPDLTKTVAAEPKTQLKYIYPRRAHNNIQLPTKAISAHTFCSRHIPL